MQKVRPGRTYAYLYETLDTPLNPRSTGIYGHSRNPNGVLSQLLRGQETFSGPGRVFGIGCFQGSELGSCWAISSRVARCFCQVVRQYQQSNAEQIPAIHDVLEKQGSIHLGLWSVTGFHLLR